MELNYATAEAEDNIVEYKNGKVEQVYPGEIKFLDTQVNWPEQEK